jgi:hypothetical protein
MSGLSARNLKTKTINACEQRDILRQLLKLYQMGLYGFFNVGCTLSTSNMVDGETVVLHSL